MNRYPKVMENYKTDYINIKVDLVFTCNLEFVEGDSGTGKTLLWQCLKNDSFLNKKLVLINYENTSEEVKDLILESKGNLIVIDNADIVLNSSKLRKHVALDLKNQYIIFGRDTKYYFLTKENMKKMNFNNNVLSIVGMFE
jgi:hypothetical protein